jgi:hypothetical protein
MKTLKNKTTGVIKRVSDKEAHQMVSASYLGWEYTSKTVWKENRKSSPTVVESNEEGNVVNEINNNLSDKKVRKQRKEQKRQKHESRK